MDAEKPQNVQSVSANLPAVLPKKDAEQQLIIPDKESLSFFQKKEPEILSLQKHQASLAEKLFPASPLEEIYAPEQVLEMETKKLDTKARLAAMYQEKEQELKLRLQEKHAFFEAKQQELAQKEQAMRQQFFGTTSTFEETKRSIQDQSQSILTEFCKIQNAIKNIEQEFRK